MNLILWVRQVCGFLILSSILKNLLAEKRYMPYVKLFMNLLLVLLLAQPLMKIDLEKIDHVWREVSADVGGDFRQQLAALAVDGSARRQADRIVGEELKSLLKTRGYFLEDLSMEYEEDTGELCSILLTVYPDPDYLSVPVILQGGAAYTGKENSDTLKQYLKEEMRLADEVLLTVRIAGEGTPAAD